MNRTVEWINDAALDWCSFVVHGSWQAALVGLTLLLVVNGAGRRWPAPFRYALLVVALLKFACPPLLPFPTGIFTQIARPTFTLLTHPERKPTQATELQSTAQATVGGASGLAFPRDNSSTSTLLLWAKRLMAVHLAGTAAVAWLIFRRAKRLRALAQACRPRLRSGLREQYRDLAIEMGVYRIPPLGISDEVEAPMAFSVPKPAIVLPTKIVGRLSASELKAVLAHELAHCRRGDLWLNWIQLLLLAIWWFHPVVWLVNRSLRDVREDCCDDLLLARRIVSNDAYCDVLLRAASELCPTLPLSAASGLSGRLHPLGRRMARIADWTLRRSENVSWAGALAVLAAAALFLPGATGREAPPANAGMPAPNLSVTVRARDGLNSPRPVPLRAIGRQGQRLKLAQAPKAKLPVSKVTTVTNPTPIHGPGVEGEITTRGSSSTGVAWAGGEGSGRRVFGMRAAATTLGQPRGSVRAWPIRQLRPPTPGILEPSAPAETIRHYYFQQVTGTGRGSYGPRPGV